MLQSVVATFFAALLGSVLGTALVVGVLLIVLFWVDDPLRSTPPDADDPRWLYLLDGRRN